ncbi:MAG: LysE family translocator [Alphaproteobacteria bacterium]|nr:MAG: LysE family translocator [Alphaproteobacteria bacterium]
MSFEFLMTTLIVVLAPGIGAIYTLSVGLSSGPKASIVAAFGCTLAILPSVLACIFGLAALLHTSALAFQILKYAGVLYLMYLAWQTLRQSGSLPIQKTAPNRNYAEITRKAILLNVLNPKLTVFFLAFLPQFIPADAPHPSALIASLGAVFMGVTFLVFVIYGLFASKIGEMLQRRPRIFIWMQRGIAGTFAAFGIKLALAEQ